MQYLFYESLFHLMQYVDKKKLESRIETHRCQFSQVFPNDTQIFQSVKKTLIRFKKS